MAGFALLAANSSRLTTILRCSRLWDLQVAVAGRSSALTNHRALMLLFTSVGILAVDFPVFPRRFAKGLFQHRCITKDTWVTFHVSLSFHTQWMTIDVCDSPTD